MSNPVDHSSDDFTLMPNDESCKELITYDIPFTGPGELPKSPPDINSIIDSFDNVNSLKKIFLNSNSKEELKPFVTIDHSAFVADEQLLTHNLNYRPYIDMQSDEMKNNYHANIGKRLIANDEINIQVMNNRLVRIQNQENSFINIKRVNDVDKVRIYTDQLPLLHARKYIMYATLRTQQLLRKLINHFLFEVVSLAVIITNITLYIIDASINYEENTVTLSDQFELTFLVIFTTELGLKLIGFGIFSQHPFYKSPWNIFDTIIIVISWMSYLNIGNLANYTFFRSLRILRVYRILSSSRQLKLKVSNFFVSINYFLEIFMILFFFYSIFAIIGLKLFSGILQRRCIDPSVQVSENIYGKFCMRDSICPVNMICQGGLSDQKFPITNFDNYFTSLFVTFQITLLEGWYALLLNLVDAFPGYLQPLVYLYFMFVIFAGNFFVLNLIKAIIIVKYNKSEKILEDVRFQKRANLIEEEAFDFLQLKICKYFNEIYYIRNPEQAFQRLITIESEQIAPEIENSQISQDFPSIENNLHAFATMKNMNKPSNVISSNSSDLSNNSLMAYVNLPKDTSYVTTKFRPPEFSLLRNISTDSPLQRNKVNRKRFKSRSQNSKLQNLQSFLKSEDLRIDERSIWTLRQELDIKKSIYKNMLQKWKKDQNRLIKVEISKDLRNRSYDKFDSRIDVIPSFFDYELENENDYFSQTPKFLKLRFNFDLILYERADKIMNANFFPNSQFMHIGLEKQVRDKKFKDLRSAYSVTIGLFLNDKRTNHFLFSRIQECAKEYYHFVIPFKSLIVEVKYPIMELGFINMKKELEDHVLRSRMNKISLSKPAMVAFFNREFREKITNENDLSEKKLSNNIIYSSIFDYDNMVGKKISRVWSGFDVLNSKMIVIEKMISIIDQFSYQNYNIWLIGVTGKIKIFRGFINEMMKSDLISFLIIVLVLINTIVLCLYGFIPEEKEYIIDRINFSLAICFILEMVLKLIGSGFVKYFKQSSNVLDATIVIFSIVELFSEGNSSTTSIRSLRLFRVFRVIKIVRLIRYLRFINVIMHVLMNSWKKLKYALIIMVTFVIMFSLIGFGLFNGTLNQVYPDGFKAQNYDNMFESIVAVFNTITLDNWDDGINILLRGSQAPFTSLIFHFIWTFIGSIVVLNLFLAVVLEGYSEPSTVDIIKELSKEEKAIIIIFQLKVENLYKRTTLKKLADKIIAKFQTNKILNSDMSYKMKKSFFRNLILQQNFKLDIVDDSNFPNDTEELIDELELGIENENNNLMTKKKYSAEFPKKQYSDFCKCSFYIFSLENKFRQLLLNIVENIFFKYFVIFVIVISCLLFAVLSYSEYMNQYTIDSLTTIDIICNVFLLVEFSLKIIAYGFIFCKQSYLRHAWGLFDFFIVICVVVDLCITDGSSVLNSLRIIRATRIFRLISHVKYFQNTLSNLYNSLSAVGNVLIIIFLFFLIYGILGVSFLRNKMEYCSDLNGNLLYGINKSDCFNSNLIWTNCPWNFDNIINALLSLYVVAFLDNWQTIMFSAADASNETDGAIYRANLAIYIYFISFVLFVVFIIFNLGIGIIFVQFQIQEEEKRKDLNQLDFEEQKWLLFLQMLPNTLPQFVRTSLMKNKAGLLLYKYYNTKTVKMIVNFLIGFSVFILALSYEGMPSEYYYTLEIVQLIITMCFIGEAVIKIFIQGQHYFYNNWQIFEFVLVIISIVDIILFFVSTNNSEYNYAYQIYKITRVARIFRLFQVIKMGFLEELEKIMNALIITVPSIINILVILVLIYFVYAILAVTAFPLATINEFENFGIAFLNMFRFSTGESWSIVMWDLNKVYPFWGTIYFISFIFFTSYLLFNMFTLIMIEQFHHLYFNPKSNLNIFKEHQKQFDVIWNIFAEKYGGYQIKEHDLYNLFISLKMPLGFNSTNDKLDGIGIYTKENFSIDVFIANLRIKDSYIDSKLGSFKIPTTKDQFVKYHFVFYVALKISFDFYDQRTKSEQKPLIKKIEKATLRHLSNMRINKGEKGSKLYASPGMKKIFVQVLFNSWVKRT